MAFADWFRSLSKEERKKKSINFQEIVLPLGLEQKDFALKTLRPFMKAKIVDSEILYAYLVSKQKYLEAKINPLIDVEIFLKKQKLFSEEEKKYILALVLLDLQATSLEEYPSDEDVKIKFSEL